MCDLMVWSVGLALTGMSLSLSRVEWQPLVVQSVFIASSSSPKSVRLGNECNWSFWYQWCVRPCVACGEGFLRSVPHHPLLELVKPRRRDLLGIIEPSSGKWKSDRPKQSCKCFVLWVNWKRPKKTECCGYCSLWVFTGVILFYPVKKTHFNLGNLTHGKLRWKGLWQTCSLNEHSGKVCGSLSFISAHWLGYWSLCVLLRNAVRVSPGADAEAQCERGHVKRE